MAEDKAPSDAELGATTTETPAPAEPVERAERAEPGEPAESAEPDDDGSPKKKVDLGALHEERKRRKAAEKRITDAEARAGQRDAFWQQRLADVEKRLAPPPAPLPDFQTDPAGYLKHSADTTSRTVQDLARWRNAQEQQRRHEGAQSQLQSAVIAAEHEFVADGVTDYPQAVAFAQSHRIDDLVGMGMTRGEATEAMRGETVWMAEQALKRGDNPADVMYKLAKRWGYRGTKPAAAADERIEEIARGTRASSAMSGSGGEAGDNLTLASVAAIEDPAEFDKAWNKLRKSGKLG